jgi:hypothetical protein
MLDSFELHLNHLYRRRKMDDFLHNLRSGKLKQHDRSNRSYNDQQYKGGQRRPAMDRRKKGTETVEQMNAIKELLEAVAETQKRIATAQEARTVAEEKKARALEVIANHIQGIFNSGAENGTVDLAPASPDAGEDVQAIDASPEFDAAESEAPLPASKKMSAEDKKAVYALVQQLRKDGISWEKIARSIAAQGYPTLSGKGSWRGVMAKNLYEKMAAE